MTQTIRNQKFYFARQSKYSNLCGLHVINNFLGYQKYTQKQLNETCESLSSDCINPHKSILGGNYDVNVLMFVFQKEGYDLAYHNYHNPIENNFQYSGFILNYEIDICPLFKLLGFGRHWSLIKKQKNCYVEYDSLLQIPTPLTNQQLIDRLNRLNNRDNTILKIVQLNPKQIVLKVKTLPQ